MIKKRVDKANRQSSRDDKRQNQLTDYKKNKDNVRHHSIHKKI